MSFTLEFFPEGLPTDCDDIWEYIEEMADEYYDDEGEKSPKLIELHKKLTEIYPCLSSYEDDDPAQENCPWADGPMIKNFASKMGMVAIVFSRVDDVVPKVIDVALELGITVVDGQSEKIIRPK